MGLGDASHDYNKKSHDLIWYPIMWASHQSGAVAKAFEIAGNIASFAEWQNARPFGDSRLYWHREALWRSVLDELASGPVTVVELGVAGGRATRFLVDALPNPQLRWHGFDTFTGLPEAWKRGGVEFAAAVTFDAGGTPPDIDDPRVTWHVGLVEDTLPEATLDLDARLLVLFDLDLYEPSSFVLRWLSRHFKPGDLLYFDEAYDPWHERRLIDEFLDQGHRVRAVGSTAIGVLLEYEAPPEPPG